MFVTFLVTQDENPLDPPSMVKHHIEKISLTTLQELLFLYLGSLL